MSDQTPLSEATAEPGADAVTEEPRAVPEASGAETADSEQAPAASAAAGAGAPVRAPSRPAEAEGADAADADAAGSDADAAAASPESFTGEPQDTGAAEAPEASAAEAAEIGVADATAASDAGSPAGEAIAESVAGDTAEEAAAAEATAETVAGNAADKAADGEATAETPARDTAGRAADRGTTVGAVDGDTAGETVARDSAAEPATPEPAAEAASSADAEPAPAAGEAVPAAEAAGAPPSREDTDAEPTRQAAPEPAGAEDSKPPATAAAAAASAAALPAADEGKAPTAKAAKRPKPAKKGAPAPPPRKPESPAVAALRTAMEEKTPVEGKVIGWNNGGFHVVVGDLTAFCPRSEMNLGPADEPSSYVDQSFRFKVLKIQKRGRRVVLSRSAVLKGERARQRKEVRKQLAPGVVLEGTVASTTDFGAFIELGGGVQGLVHVSELSRQRVGKPSEILETGQTVQVKVLKVEQGGKRISLSMRALEPDPWRDIKKRYPQGATVKGTVEKATNFGAFIELEPGLTGLLPASAMSIPRETSPARIYPPGKEVSVQVMSVDSRRQRISLALEGSTVEGSRVDYKDYLKSQAGTGKGGFNALANALSKLRPPAES